MIELDTQTAEPIVMMFFPGLGMGELIIIAVIVLIFFGPGKLPEVARSLGDGIRQFKKAAMDPPASENREAAATERQSANKE